MTTPIPNNDPEQLLAAFADGELDGEQNLDVLRRLQDDPSLTQRVTGHQKLRSAVAKAMDSNAKPSDDLRDRIAELARTVPTDTTQPAPPAVQHTDSPVLARIGKWAPAAVAAVFFIGALVTLNIVTNTNTDPGGQLITNANVLNASLVEQFGNRHFKCSRELSPLHGKDRFPQNLAELPQALSDYFHKQIGSEVLDLSALGYEFDAAGLCILPGEGAVHVIYKDHDANGDTQMLSVWIRPYDANVQIESDHTYTTIGQTDIYPMIVWRHGDMVYYLVGDTTDTVKRAFEVISQGQG